MKLTIVVSSMKRQRPKPKTGDEKLVKGVVMIRQRLNHNGRWVVRSGRPAFEWVVKGSADDRSAKKVLPAPLTQTGL